MKRVVCIVFIFMFLSTSLNARVKWKEIELPLKVKSIIGGKSIDNLWVLDSLNTIIHFSNNKYEKFNIKSIFNHTSIRSYSAYYISENRVFVVLIESDWTSHIAEIVDGKIISYSFSTDVPIHKILKISDDIYAFGDFGLIVKLDSGKWTNVNTPIVNTFTQVEQLDSSKVLLNVINKGIYSFDGVQIQHCIIDSALDKLLLRIGLDNGKAYVRGYYGKVYKLENDTFTQTNLYDIAIFSKAVYYNANEIRIRFSSGKSIIVPICFNVKDAVDLKDGHVVLLVKNGVILYDYKTNNNYFNNYASTMGIGGENRDQSSIIRSIIIAESEPHIIINDFNNDNRKDILAYEDYSKNMLALNIAENGFVYNNNTRVYNLDKPHFDGILISAFDINQDNKVDIIATESKKKNKISVYSIYRNKYQLVSELRTPSYCILNRPSSNYFTDFDKDGDLDILLTYGYSINGKGSVLLYRNNSYGTFTSADTSLSKTLSGWNTSTLMADFNNDDLNDILLSKSWSHNSIFFQEQNGKWRKVGLSVSDSLVYIQRSSYSIAFDFDNDGDLDIFSLYENPTLRVYENRANGDFVEITNELGFDTLFAKYKMTDIMAFDFNNDGYTDIFAVLKNGTKIENKIFINDSSFHFRDFSVEMEINNSKIIHCAASDIDNDGDIDIFGLGEYSNYLWINNLNDKNYINLKLKGIKSNTSALGAKVWIYQAGHINENKFLCAYKQLGSKLVGKGYQNSLEMHFGLNKNKTYDIKVQFYGGFKRELSNISTGQTIVIPEISGILKYIYTLDNRAANLLSNKEFLAYAFTIILGLTALALSIYYGHKLFAWNVRLTSLIISLDIILFTILLFVLYHIDTNNRYLIPLGFALLGSIGPLGVFMWIDKNQGIQSKDDYEYLLLQSVLNFSHGEWAASNLNSLQLLFENISYEDIADVEYIQSFDKRKKTFIELTAPVIEEIISLLSRIEDYKDIATDLNHEYKKIANSLSKEINNETIEHRNEISKPILKIREILSDIKKLIFVKYSCSPVNVFNNLQDNILKTTKKNQVSFKFINFLTDKDMALVECKHLSSIIENCVQNSMKAMKKAPNKELIIKFINDDLRYLISISDRGCGISEKDKDLIFENGYSTNSSTGFGLYFAKDILSKYGGRIYVKESEAWVLTSFIIELQKVADK